MPNDALDKLREIAENLIKMAPHHVAQDLLRDTGLEIYTLLPALEQQYDRMVGQWEGAKLDWVVEHDRADALEQRERELRLDERTKFPPCDCFHNPDTGYLELCPRCAVLRSALNPTEAALPEEGKV
jgi:hypothetical protein